MHVALVPTGDVTGNSLGVAFFRRGPACAVELLMAVMNSMAFELQVRRHLSTSHISQGVLRRCALPLPCFAEPRLMAELFQLPQWHLQSDCAAPAMEVCVARAYGLSRSDFGAVLQAFPKITPGECAAHLHKDLWQ